MDKTTLFADAVFEGGGVKGIGLVGAAAVVEEHGYRWSNLAGASAGAIVAALLAAGYTAPELRKIVSELDYRKLKDVSTFDKVPMVGPLTSVIFEKGIYEGRFFENWMRGLLKAKKVSTFKDLIIDEFKDDDRFRFKLRVIASDVSRGRILVLPQDIAEFGINPEDLDVAFAVRMSMSIPFFYEPVRVRYKSENQSVYIVDGGMLSNFPLWIFDSESMPEWPTFGFKLVEPESKQEIPHRIKGPISMLTGLFATMMEAHDARYIKDEQFVRTIPIPTLGVGTTEFDITAEKSEALYQSGRQAGEKFLTTWDFAEYVEKYRKGNPELSRTARLRLG